MENDQQVTRAMQTALRYGILSIGFFGLLYMTIFAASKGIAAEAFVFGIVTFLIGGWLALSLWPADSYSGLALFIVALETLILLGMISFTLYMMAGISNWQVVIGPVLVPLMLTLLIQYRFWNKFSIG